MTTGQNVRVWMLKDSLNANVEFDVMGHVKLVPEEELDDLQL